MKLYKFLVIYLLISFATLVSTANILCLTAMIHKLHHMWNRLFFRGLVMRGHNLTVISTVEPIKPYFPQANYIVMENALKNISDIPAEYDADDQGFFTIIDYIERWNEINYELCIGIMSSKGYQRAIEEVKRFKDKYDLIIYDATLNPWCLLALASYVGNVNILAMSAKPATSETFVLAGGGYYMPAIVPHILSPYKEKMDYVERLYNLVFYAYENLAYAGYGLELLNDTDQYAVMNDVIPRIRVVLVNSNPALDCAQTLPSNIFEIAGMHVLEPQGIPIELLNTMESAEKGIVIMNLHEGLTLRNIDENKLLIIFKVMRSLPEYIFFWNIEDKGMEVRRDKPQNLYTGEIFPPQEMMTYSRSVLFITDGMRINLLDALHNAVPVICIPYRLDQLHNIQRVLDRNLGIVLHWNDLTETSLLHAINSTIWSVEIASNMSLASIQYHNRLQQPITAAVYWTESLSTQPGIYFQHLISPAAKEMGFLIIHNYDSLILVIFSIITISSLTWFGLWSWHLIVRKIIGPDETVILDYGGHQHYIRVRGRRTRIVNPRENEGQYSPPQFIDPDSYGAAPISPEQQGQEEEQLRQEVQQRRQQEEQQQQPQQQQQQQRRRRNRRR